MDLGGREIKRIGKGKGKGRIEGLNERRWKVGEMREMNMISHEIRV